MFESARLKLTGLYVIMFLVVSGAVSFVFYQGTTLVLENRFRQIEMRIDIDQGLMRPGLPLAETQLDLLKDDLEETKRQIAARLIVINGAIVLVYAAAGYILSAQTLEPIERSVREQEQFVANAAHELRTPLAAMKVTTEVELRGRRLTGRGREVLKGNLEEIERLEKLTEKLLILARLDELNQLESNRVEMNRVVKEVIETVRLKAKQKGVKLKASLSHERVEVEGDGELLRVMIGALTDNGVKYTKKGGWVEVRVRADKKKVKLEVEDNGVGMSQQVRANLFRRFYRGDKARVKQGENGYGLGLALVNKIVNLHEGKVEVKSEEGKGSWFGVELARKLS